jgi:mRNA interferase MazF
VKRGDLVTIALSGDYGKPRPALVLQSDLFRDLPSLTVLPITSELRATPLLRLSLIPDRQNGLQRESQVMVDKITTVARNKAGKPGNRAYQRTPSAGAIRRSSVSQFCTSTISCCWLPSRPRVIRKRPSGITPYSEPQL